MHKQHEPEDSSNCQPVKRLSSLLVFEEAVTRIMNEDHMVSVIYLDFAKAIDSVNHRFLLSKMKSLGLGDVDVRWIEASISGRVSRVHVGIGELSLILRTLCSKQE